MLWDGKIDDALREIPEAPVRRLARLVLVYLLSSPRSLSWGLYEISRSTIGRHTELSDEEVQLALVALADVDLAFYDNDREVIFVVHMAEIEHPKGMKVADYNHVALVKYLDGGFATGGLRRSKVFQRSPSATAAT
jgi:hypothetical protein